MADTKSGRWAEMMKSTQQRAPFDTISDRKAETVSLREAVPGQAEDWMESQQPGYAEQMRVMDAQAGAEKSLLLAESFIKKDYLEKLSAYKVNPAPRSLRELPADKTTCLFQMTGLALNQKENVLEKLNNVYAAMHGLGVSLVFLLVSYGNKNELYFGVRSKKGRELAETVGHAFQKTFQGNFPGSELVAIPAASIPPLLEHLLPEDGKNSVTALTSIPALKMEAAQNEQYTQGIEKLIDTMQGKRYAVLILSNPVDRNQLAYTKQGYEELYSELSPLASTDLTIGKSDAASLSVSEMDGYAKTVGESVAKTQSFSHGVSSTRSESTTHTKGFNVGGFGSINGGSGSNKSTNSTNSRNIFKTTFSSLFGGEVAKVIVGGTMKSFGGAGGLNAGIQRSTAETEGLSTGEQQNWQEGKQRSKQQSLTENRQQGLQEGSTVTDSTSAGVKLENKSVQILLETIDEHLARIKECENYGMWASAAYFISPVVEESVVAASAYRGIINGEGTALEHSCINSWFRDEPTRQINQYLRLLAHPTFYDPAYQMDYEGLTDVTAATMVNTKELSIQCGVPFRSVPGVAVREMAEFGRNIYSLQTKAAKTIPIGNIFHVGQVEKGSAVALDIEHFREHTFVTGSTGSGKSNTIYGIISRLWSMHHVPTLVIEPAKGEYKQVFGKQFHVYGTNPDYTELLRINPFRFDPKIHVLEHIDRLIDIFNVCWPMYAAMPAVLKEAVELAYTQAGWDLDTSKNRCDSRIYPCFQDVLEALREVISHSDYSQEVKDNYTGSLITRVKSLTNGLNGRIFTSDEIDNRVLFDENTIIDLSRVGSSETKSMIMGIMIMRLQEHRMAKGGINLPLKHLTVLEEAHNILKHTSTEQSSESSNLLGKSVEMIANAIAEMRTYGEGFLIADQAPALLDRSAIRNTNTKIILRLPDEEDRMLVGKSAGLRDEQVDELAKLSTGVAAIHQNTWIDPVLCQIDYFSAKPTEYAVRAGANPRGGDRLLRDEILQYVLSRVSCEKPMREVEKLKARLIDSTLSAAVKIKLYGLLKQKRPETLDEVYLDIAACCGDIRKLFRDAAKAKTIDQWNQILYNGLEFEMDAMSDACRKNILECIVRKMAEEENPAYYQRWVEHMEGRHVF